MLAVPAPRWRLALTGLALSSALAATACSGDPAGSAPGPEAPAATTASATPPTGSASPTASSTRPDASGTATPARRAPSPRASATAGSSPSGSPSAPEAPDPEAPASPTPVARGSQAERLAPVQGDLDATLRWSDGVRLQVRDVTNAVLEGKGPGAVNGPVSSFRLRLTNGSSEPVDATQVVVTLAYGRSAARLATPVYDDRAADFGTRLAPGESATARYSFAVPRSGRSAVALTVDLDARHGLATFRGDAG